MVERFVDTSKVFVWSSAKLESAMAAVSVAVGGTPEPFLRSVWELLGQHVPVLRLGSNNRRAEPVSGSDPVERITSFPVAGEVQHDAVEGLELPRDAWRNEQRVRYRS
jgi:hypothetical protein